MSSRDSTGGVISWDPSAAGKMTLDDAALARFLAAAEADAAKDERFGLSEAGVQELAGLASDSAPWKLRAGSMDSAQLVSLIRLFTLAEDRLPGWQAGAKSPVIALARALRERGEFPDELSSWIKGNTSNKFLPYGSLMDRL